MSNPVCRVFVCKNGVACATIRVLDGGVRRIAREMVIYGLKSIIRGCESWSAGIDSDMYDRRGDCNQFKRNAIRESVGDCGVVLDRCK